MNTFTLELQSATQHLRVENVHSFVGEDRTGEFGILAGHARFMTVFVFGLARYRAEGVWQFVALPGGLLYFADDVLTVNTRRFLVDSDYGRMSTALSEQLRDEEEELRGIKESLHRMEEEMFRRVWEIRRRGGPAP